MNFILLAAESAPNVVAESGPWWMYPAAVIGIAVLGLVARLLNSLGAKAGAEAKKSREAGKIDLKNEAISVLTRIVSNVAEKEKKELEVAAADGKVSKEDLKKLGDNALEAAKDEFKEQGIDLVKELGPQFMASALRFAVDKAKKKS